MAYPRVRVAPCLSCGTQTSARVEHEDEPRCAQCASASILSSSYRPPPLPASPPRTPRSSAEAAAVSSASLSPAEVDRHLEARLHSLTSQPVSVYLPAPSASQLQSRLHRLLGTDSGLTTERPSEQSLEDRLHRLSRGEGSSEAAASHDELERRLMRLQGHDDEAACESKEQQPGTLISPTPGAAPASAVLWDEPEDGGEDDVETLLKQLHDEVKLDYLQVHKVGERLARPFRTSTSAASASRAGVTSPPPPVDVDDPQKLMDSLQSLPSTEVLRLKEMAGEGQPGEGDENGGEDDDHVADAIVRQAMDEARMGKEHEV